MTSLRSRHNKSIKMVDRSRSSETPFVSDQEEHSKGKRKIGTSNVDLGSPLKGVEQVYHNSRSMSVADKGVFSNKGTRSRPQETNNVNQVETESPDDLSGPAVTCLAVTSGSELVIPRLPPVTDGHRKRGVVNVIKNYVLMDEESRLWPASYHAETKILCCSWGHFAAANGVEAGDWYHFAVDDEQPATYKIIVLCSI